MSLPVFTIKNNNKRYIYEKNNYMPFTFYLLYNIIYYFVLNFNFLCKKHENT